MNKGPLLIRAIAVGIGVLILGLGVEGRASTYYVATSGDDSAAGTNWATAKLTIQAAVDIALSNDTVLVSNGVYATGGRAVAGGTTNRVLVSSNVTVRSVNGPAVTTIQGNRPNGSNAVRCVYLAANANLSGFTLANGATWQESGGGALCATSAVISNCMFTANSAASSGGGCFGGTLNNCILSSNSAASGGGAYQCTLNSCTVSGNSGCGVQFSTLKNCALIGNSGSSSGGAYFSTLYNCTLIGNRALGLSGGAYQCTLYNCIAFYNAASSDWNSSPGDYDSCTISNSCTTLLAAGSGNIAATPLLAGLDNPHLLPGSPCVNKGNNSYAVGGDVDGESRIVGAIVDIGCDEYGATPTGVLSVVIRTAWTNVGTGFSISFDALVQGHPVELLWDWGDGTATTNLCRVTHAFAATGVYAVVLRATNLSTAAFATTTVNVVEAPMFFVAPGGGHVPPYSTWATAATNIQAAVDVATVPGSLVLVSNGIYASGGRVVTAASPSTNRVAITNAITVRSVNGASVTTIAGAFDPVSIVGPAAMRCVLVGPSATLSGFTLTGGSTWANGVGGGGSSDYCGGGAMCAVSALVQDCLFLGNRAGYGGGGAYGGSLYRCLFSGNQSFFNGGGTCFGTMYDCAYFENVSTNNGGGAYRGSLYQCTLAGNRAAGNGGGAYSGALINSIAFFNTDKVGQNYFGVDINYSCTTPLPAGSGNITNAPNFVATNDYHLAAGSRCINAGNNLYVPGATDMDGHARIVNGVVDMGACEFLPYAWWATAITNGLTNATDCATFDGYPNLLKYATGSSPTESDALPQVTGVWTNDRVALRFNRNTNATDVTLIVEACEAATNDVLWRGLATNKLGSWGGTSNVAQSGSGSPVVVTFVDAATAATNRFLRLRVTIP